MKRLERWSTIKASFASRSARSVSVSAPNRLFACSDRSDRAVGWAPTRLVGSSACRDVRLDWAVSSLVVGVRCWVLVTNLLLFARQARYWAVISQFFVSLLPPASLLLNGP